MSPVTPAFAAPAFVPRSTPQLAARRTWRAPRPLALRKPAPAMVSGGYNPEPQGQEKKKTTTSSSTNATQEDELVYPTLDLDTAAIKETALRAVEDVGTRPGYYGKILGYSVGALVSITVLKSVVTAIDALPVLPGVLELIGLGYCAWFGWRYVIFKSSREELLEEIDDLLGRTTGRN